MLQSNKISPLKFWLSHGDSYLSLQPLAKQVFSMVASSAASSERNFSTFGFVHSKLRNCLSDESVQKLVVYIKTNNTQFMKDERQQHAALGDIEFIGSDSDYQSSI
jgi:hAT family C-terminal dimerisation region